MKVDAKGGGLLHGGAKTIATVASTGAALVSIITFLHAWGIIGEPASRATVGNFGAHWIGVRPLVDTARTVGDTIHLAATITDKNGSILFGARPTWTTENPAVATVAQDGSVVARGPGATTIIAVVGELSARTRIVVHQTVTAVRIAGDSAVQMAEGEVRPLEARAFDARGYAVPARPASWKVEDGAAVSLDSAGRIQGLDAGRAVVSATIESVGAQALVIVAPTPAALAMVKGDAQRARAGATLPERVVVRVVNRRGRPVEGTLVRFRATAGVVDPAAVVTDVDGRARTAWTLGDQPGIQRLHASVEHVDSALVLHAEAEPVAENTRLIAVRDSIPVTVGSVDTVVVRVADSTGRALPDVPVTWTVPAASGKVTPMAARTDSLGEARAEWRLPGVPGLHRLRARVGGDVPPLAITAVSRAGAPATLSLERATKKGTAPSRSTDVVIHVRDSFGNPVAAAAVKLQAKSGSVSSPTITTDSTGRARTVWTLADRQGSQTLVAVTKGAADTLAASARRATKSAVTQAGRRRP